VGAKRDLLGRYADPRRGVRTDGRPVHSISTALFATLGLLDLVENLYAKLEINLYYILYYGIDMDLP
jgi:hypothetical protein